MRSPVRFWVFVLALLLPWSAMAQLEVCNRTEGPIRVAIGHEGDKAKVARGWWDVELGKCAVVIDTPLDRSTYYHYVFSPTQGLEWKGPITICTSSKPTFETEGSANCEGRGLKSAGFRATEIGRKADGSLFSAFTLTISSESNP